MGQRFEDMNLFAASGAVMTVFGLLSMIKFTTIEKFLNQEEIVANSTGMTGRPMLPEQEEQYQKEYQAAVNTRLAKELKTELKGILLSVCGTLIWAYGGYVPQFL